MLLLPMNRMTLWTYLVYCEAVCIVMWLKMQLNSVTIFIIGHSFVDRAIVTIELHAV